MAHLVNVVQLNEQGEHVRVKYTHEFMFEVSAKKWMDGFNRVYNMGDGDDDDDNFVAVYVGEKETNKS